MNTMLRKTGFCGLIMLVTLAACGPRSTPTPIAAIPTTPVSPVPAATLSSTQPTDLCQNPLFPLTENAIYKYTSSDSPAGPYSFTRRITNVRSDGFTILTEFNQQTLQQDWVCTPEGLFPLQLSLSDITGLIAFQRFKTITLSNPSGVVFPSSLRPDSEWSFAADVQGTALQPDGTPGETLQGRISITYSVQGQESVTLPLGIFDSTRIEVNSVIDATLSTQSGSVSWSADSTYTVWYAPQIGWVKSNGYGRLGGREFLETILLTLYETP